MIEEKEEQITYEYVDEVKKCWDWFDSDRSAKTNIQDDLEEAYKLYNCDHWSLKDPTGRLLRTENQKKNRPNSVENFTFSLIEGLVAEFTEEVDLIDYPVEPGDDDTALVMTELKKFLMYKNRMKLEREKFVRNFFLYGTGIWHVYWDPSWKGGRGPNRWNGDIRWKSAHPQAIYPDLRCRTDIEEGNRVHKAVYTTTEYIKEKFGVEVEGESVSNTNIIDDDEATTYDNDSREVLLVETWYKGKPLIEDDNDNKGEEDSGLHVIWWAGEHTPVYLAHDNYVYYEPGEDTKFPFIFRARYPRENSVWGYGEAHFLKSPQIVLNKTTELILEAHMHNALGQTFYRAGSITPKQEKFLKKFGTIPNMYFPVNNLDDIKRIHGQGVAPSLPNEATRIEKSMEGIIGRHDISQGRTPGSVVAFRALDLLAARARVRLRSAENAIISSYEDCGNYINNLITQYYTEKRAYRIMGENAEKQEYVLVNQQTGEERPYVMGQPLMPGWIIDVRQEPAIKYGTFNLEEHKKVYVYDNTTGYGETVPYDDHMAEAIYQTELMREAGEEFDSTVDYEVYYPQMDTKCKVSSAQPTDRAFYMEMGKELFMNQLIDEETFWYILQNGKFPPYEEIMDKKKKEMMAAAQTDQEMQMMQQQQAQMQQAPMQPPMGSEPNRPELDGAVIQQIMQNNPDMLEKFNQLTPEMQQQVLQQVTGGGM